MSESDGSGREKAPPDVARQHALRADTLRRSASGSSGEARSVLLREAAGALFAAGDESGGRAAAREAFDAWPADDASFLTVLRDATEDIDRLEAVLAARARAVPAEADACLRARADALLAFGRPEAALTAYQRCLEHLPQDPGALAGIAEAHAELGQAEAALEAARRLVGVSAGAEARGAALDLAARLAGRFGDRGRDAADLLESAAAVLLKNGGAGEAQALVERAIAALLRAGENARASALMALASSTARGAVRAQWLVRLAEAALARGDVAAARLARDEALRADPSDAALRDLHLTDLERAGEGGVLVRAVEAALAAPGADVVSLTLRLGRARAAAGDDPGAERAFAAVCELGPGTPGWGEAARVVAGYLEAKGDLDGRARLELARARASGEPPVRAAALLTAASLLERAGDLGRARHAAERARDLDPGAVDPWKMLARLQLAAGDQVGAARSLLAAAERCAGPASAAAGLDAARLLQAAGLAAEAGAALEHVIATVPGSPAARHALAERARAAGDRAGAVRHLSLVDRDALSGDERHAHERALARALSDAGDASAERAWRALFDADEADGEAFDRVSELLRARSEPEQWLALAARHEGALSGGADRARRCDLRCERAALLTDLGHLDAAEGAWQAALALDPRHRRALRGMRAFLEQRGDHAGAADRIAAEAQVAQDPEEAAELFVDEARISLERLHDRARAARAIAAAVERLRSVPPRRARRLLAQAGRMGVDTEVTAPAPAALAEPVADDGGPAEDDRLRALAEVASGGERAAYLHRLSVRLERRGDHEGALDAALAALEADPSSPERYQRAVTLSGGDQGQLLAIHRLRARGARTPAARAAALLELGTILAARPETLPEASEMLERAHALQPASGAAAAALGRALLAMGDPDRAVAVLSRFEAGAPDLPASEAARLLVEAAQAAGDSALAVEMARRAADRSPRDTGVLTTLSSALAAAGRERDALAVEERVLALEPPGPERMARQAALAARAEAAGDHARALWLYQGLHAARPRDVAVMAALARLSAAANDSFQLAAAARELEHAGAGDALGALAAAAGRALLRGGDATTALPYLRRAHLGAPGELAVLRDLAVAAERAGDFAEALRAGTAVAEAERGSFPAAAATRLLRLADLAAGALLDPRLAGDLRRRAAELGPFETAPAELAPPANPPREAAPRSVEAALAGARAALFDAAAAGQAAGLARLLASGTPGPQVTRLAVLARSAAAIAAFAAETTPRGASAARPVRVAPDASAAVAHPLAQSAPARLLALLAPFLEPLFPADLGRHGCSGAQRLGPRCAPELLTLLDETQRALGARPCAAFLSDALGSEVAFENTTPPSIIIGAGVAGPLPASERRFLLARALVLVDLGWAIAGKFAPRDVAIVCELACRFGGAPPAATLLPEERARPFLEALAEAVPKAMREQLSRLAARAAPELPGIPPVQLTAALRQTAARIALLHTGDPYAALNASLASDRRLSGLRRTEALQDPDLRDLGAFALSDAYLDRRAQAEATA